MYWVYAPSFLLIIDDDDSVSVRGRVFEVRLSGCFLKKSSAEIFFGGSAFFGVGWGVGICSVIISSERLVFFAEF